MGWDWVYVALLVATGLTLVFGLRALLLRPTGPRVVRFARRYVARNPLATDADLRHALQVRFLGGLETGTSAVDAAVAPTSFLTDLVLSVAEAVRDFFFPLDRRAISAQIEAAVRIVRASESPDASEVGSKPPS